MTSKDEVLAAMRKEIWQEAAPGEWFTIDQALIDQFATINGVAYVMVYDSNRAQIAHTFVPFVPPDVVDKNVVPGDLAKQVREVAQSKSEIVFVPYEKAYEQGFEDMPRRVPDTGKIRNLIGWRPTIELPQILADVVEFYRRGP